MDYKALYEQACNVNPEWVRCPTCNKDIGFQCMRPKGEAFDVRYHVSRFHAAVRLLTIRQVDSEIQDELDTLEEQS